jgi:putative ABC transport system permease protein
LRPEVSFEQAQAFTIATSGGLAGGPSLAALRLAPFVSPLASTRATLGVLLLGVAMLFTIAIVNATTLLLAEAVRRDGELALRAALGARPWRLARLLLTETLLLAAAAAMLALLLARLLLAEVANSLSYLMVYQALRPIALDWRSVGFSIAIAIAAGSAVGLAAVARTERRAVHASLARLEQRGGRASWMQRALIVCQLSITLVLLCCAGLLAHSGVRLARADPGFDPQHLLTVGIELPRWRFPDGPTTRLLLDRLRSEAVALPGVERATLSESIPPHLSFMISRLETDDRGPVASPGTLVATNNSDAGYLATLGIPILAGRAFGPEDVPGAPAATVISRALAELLWPGQSPLGRRFRVDPEEPWLTVVGVAGNARNGGFDSGLGLSAVYRPVEQQPLSGYATLVVRTSGAPEGCAPSLRATVRRLLPEAPISEVQTAYQVIGDSNQRVRFVTAVMASVAGTALLLALIGVYAAFWYAVRQRTHELGVRVALGATPRDLSRMVLGDSARLAAVALAIGGPGALAAASLLRGMLYEVSPGDPATLAAVGLLLFGLALCAALVPARHAARADPLLALRHE